MQTILNDQLNSCGSLWAPLYIHTSKMCRYPYTYIHLRLGLWMATSLDIGLAGWLAVHCAVKRLKWKDLRMSDPDLK